MQPLPSGIVTFLFTDIEGSTRLIHRLRDGYAQVLDDHDRLVRSAVEAEGGVVVGTEGDSYFAAFPTPAPAVRAALSAQRSLGAHPWPPGGAVHVRMGVHTGTATPSRGNYAGIDVNRAARIAGAAHGGQVLVSAATREMLRDDAIELAVSLRDLGSYRLKDLPEPERLFQVEVRDLPNNFPPLRSLEVRPHNLPTQLSEFVGRTREIVELSAALEEARLVTLVGPGGMGKTRLAVAVASEILPRFDDGVVYVDLAAVRDPDEVPPAVGRAVGLSDTGDTPIVDAVFAYFVPRCALLVLDNFEQVLDAGKFVHGLLAAAPLLRVLVTSRVLLRISGERVFAVPALELPQGQDPDEVAGTESITLFVRRASSVDPAFVLTAENVQDVVAIVRRLEGLPLALELAAARIRLLPPRQLAARLEDGLAALGSGAADLPSRHRTLRDAIAWSYELLGPVPSALLRRLGVFAGGFTLAAAEAVGVGDPVDDPIEPLADLLDASLIRRRVEHGDIRFSLLEPIREFALEQLATAGALEHIRERHATHTIELAEEAGPHLSGDDRVAWIDRLGVEHDNIRAALRFAVESNRTDLGLRIGGAIWRFWHATGQHREGRAWLEQLLGLSGATSAARATGLSGLAGIAYWQADYATAMATYEEALPLYRELGDRRSEADTILGMSTTASWNGDLESGSRLAAQARELYEELGARGEVRSVLMALGFVTWMRGDPSGARPLWEESLQIARDLGDHAEAATNELALASLSFLEGDLSGALETAAGALDELVDLKDTNGLVMALDWVAALTAELEPLEATRLAGAAEALRTQQGGGMRPEGVGLESARQVAEQLLSRKEVNQAWEQGLELETDVAVVLARRLAAKHVTGTTFALHLRYRSGR